MSNRIRVRFIVQAALIAALYAVLTLAFQPISFGAVQMRVSEALCVLLIFSSAAVPGLFVGCFLANLIAVSMGNTVPIDMVVGSLTTLLAAYLGYRMRKLPWLVPLPSVVLNAVFVGAMIYYVFIPEAENASLALTMLYVGLGQMLACYVIGMPLYYALKRMGFSQRLALT